MLTLVVTQVFRPRYNVEDFRYIKNVLPLFSDTEDFANVTKIELNDPNTLTQLCGHFRVYFNFLQKRLGTQVALTHVLAIRIDRKEWIDHLYSSFIYSLILLLASWFLMGFTSIVLIPHLTLASTISAYRSTQHIISFALGFEWGLILLIMGGYLKSTLNQRLRVVKSLNDMYENNIVRLWLSNLLASHMNTLFKLVPLTDFIELELHYPNKIYQILLRSVIRETKKGTPFIETLHSFDPYFIRILRLNQFSSLSEEHMDQYLKYNLHVMNRKLSTYKKTMQFSVYIQLSVIILTIYQLILAPMSLMEGLM